MPCAAASAPSAPNKQYDDDPIRTALGAGVFAFGGLSAVAGKVGGERDTAAGREVAARWLGVRAWLRGHEAFADDALAAVAIWDRYLSYGVAVGATRVSSAVIDLGMGNRKRVWSSYTGIPPGETTWHRVRVHYPRFWPRYGKTAPKLFLRAVIAAAIGYVLVRFWYSAWTGCWPSRPKSAVDSSVTLIKGVGLLAGLALLVYGAYVVLRTVIDLLVPNTITGEVIWTERWRSGQNNAPSLDYLAVDEASGDSTRAVALPAPLHHGFGDGDVVTFKVRRWSRRVIDVTPVSQGAASRLAQSDAGPIPQFGVPAERPGQITGFGAVSGLLGMLGAVTPVGPLFTAAEVGAVLDMPVVAQAKGAPGSTPMPVEITEYTTSDGAPARRPVVRSAGTFARMAMRSQGRGEVVAGLGDEARGGPGWLAVRRGDDVVMLKTGAVATSLAPRKWLGLAHTAAGRLPVTAG